MYQQSLDALRQLQDTGKLNPENVNKPAEMAQKIAKCDANLAAPR